ncbi:MAG TPA: LysM peptidoglycan-binding domain-containing M23 family metallopeptidase [Anaeromyxobacteraceae bacterium]|nr:LysM peptidoglycan-binding domain-containing M23 family metallopeptidase [Anaeromyxobacteraceae bacterium]
MRSRALPLVLLLGAASCGHRAAAPPGGEPALQPGAEGHLEPELVGVVHVVKQGETLYRIARAYGVPLADLVEVNDLGDPRQLAAGSELFVPGAARRLDLATGGEAAAQPARPDEPEPPPRADRVTPRLRWPLQGVLYSRYGVRQGQRHDGIDISAPEGTHVGAAAPGAVIYAGVQAGYGSIVILRHEGGLLTLYAHASALLVHQGERVAAGQPIARVGQSGRTSGPHLHFEVREGTRPRNPLLYLP